MMSDFDTQQKLFKFGPLEIFFNTFLHNRITRQFIIGLNEPWMSIITFKIIILAQVHRQKSWKSLSKFFFYFLLSVKCFLIFDINSPSPGDTKNPVADDICSSEVKFPNQTSGVSFYNQTYGRVWVCNNGILSVVHNKWCSIRSWSLSYWRDFYDSRFLGNDDNIGVEEGVECVNRIIWRLDTPSETAGPISVILKQNTDAEHFHFDAACGDSLWRGMKLDIFNVKPTYAIPFKSFWHAMRTQNVSVCLNMKKIEWTNSRVQRSHAQAGFNDREGKLKAIQWKTEFDCRPQLNLYEISACCINVYRKNFQKT